MRLWRNNLEVDSGPRARDGRVIGVHNDDEDLVRAVLESGEGVICHRGSHRIPIVKLHPIGRTRGRRDGLDQLILTVNKGDGEHLAFFGAQDPDCAVRGLLRAETHTVRQDP